jgi:DNA-binding MarR family transcriptional regulator
MSKTGQGTNTTDRAEKRGLVQRFPNPLDGRGIDITLTAAGVELAERGAEVIAKALSR